MFSVSNRDGIILNLLPNCPIPLFTFGRFSYYSGWEISLRLCFDELNLQIVGSFVWSGASQRTSSTFSSFLCLTMYAFVRAIFQHGKLQWDICASLITKTKFLALTPWLSLGLESSGRSHCTPFSSNKWPEILFAPHNTGHQGVGIDMRNRSKEEWIKDDQTLCTAEFTGTAKLKGQ